MPAPQPRPQPEQPEQPDHDVPAAGSAPACQPGADAAQDRTAEPAAQHDSLPTPEAAAPALQPKRAAQEHAPLPAAQVAQPQKPAQDGPAEAEPEGEPSPASPAPGEVDAVVSATTQQSLLQLGADDRVRVRLCVAKRPVPAPPAARPPSSAAQACCVRSAHETYQYMQVLHAMLALGSVCARMAHRVVFMS